MTVEQQFRHYLKTVKLNPRKMPRRQLRELRRAFFGAAGHVVVFLAEIAELPEEEAVKKLETLRQEVEAFWSVETNNPRQN